MARVTRKILRNEVRNLCNGDIPFAERHDYRCGRAAEVSAHDERKNVFRHEWRLISIRKIAAVLKAHGKKHDAETVDRIYKLRRRGKKVVI